MMQPHTVSQVSLHFEAEDVAADGQENREEGQEAFCLQDKSCSAVTRCLAAARRKAHPWGP